ncbi:hypothetical protein ElyMa_003169100 [Elysia marginata]|uniref:Uncharacterized protein n=1 Tax=Elysia marginata TaxID=1093978 RepID=A0AAV4IYA2_9GAST|nr:hypothetical protein ElyMa_003169100 [Elysia marginata]
MRIPLDVLQDAFNRRKAKCSDPHAQGKTISVRPRLKSLKDSTPTCRDPARTTGLLNTQPNVYHWTTAPPDRW